MWNRTKQHRRKKLFFPTLFDQRLRSNDEHTKMLLMRSAAIVCRFKSSAYIFVTSHYSVFTSLINLLRQQKIARNFAIKDSWLSSNMYIITWLQSFVKNCFQKKQFQYVCSSTRYNLLKKGDNSILRYFFLLQD